MAMVEESLSTSNHIAADSYTKWDIAFQEFMTSDFYSQKEGDLLENFAKWLMPLACKRVGRLDVDFVLNEFITKVWLAKKNRQYKPEIKGRFSWFYKILTCVCIDYARKKPPLKNVNALQNFPAPLEVMIAAEEKEMLFEKLQKLPTAQREMIILHYYEDLSYREIADMMGNPVGTVQSCIFRGVQLLRYELQKKNR